jgi:endonuclease YncB( thermonuclease family)
LWLGLAAVGCDQQTATGSVAAAESGTSTADDDSVLRTSAEHEREGLLVAVLPLGASPVIDGDTIRVKGLERSVRLLSIDTEETFHGNADRAAAAKDFEAYLRRKRGDSPRPVKTGTPMGEEAKRFARAFFEDVDMVRLERDHAKEIRGHYGRLLAHAIVQKEGRWVPYNLECVRAGMSPYFTKYGYSNRFHKDFVAAEVEAREAKRGIWNPATKSYGDYEERRAWWNARADFIRAFEHEASGRDDYIQLSHWDAEAKLEEALGQEVTVLSTIDRIKHFKTLIKVDLAAPDEARFPVVFFDKDVFRRSGIGDYDKEPVMVRGTVERYEKGRYSTLQIVVRNADQLTLPTLPEPRSARFATD